MWFPIRYVCTVYFLLGVVYGELTAEEEGMIDSFMEELIECRGFPGTALALVRDGSIELSRGYGFANVENQEPFTEDSRFAIASVSKSFTTTLAAKLMATRPGLNWESYARDILGEDFHFIDGYRSNNTMLRDLASHQTGIPRYDAVWVLDNFDSREEIVMGKIRFMEEYFPIRSDFRYNNNMFSVLGQVLETEFGASWEELLTNELLSPLGLNSTTFYDVAAPDYEGFVTPYTYNISADDPLVLVESPYESWSGSHLVGPAGSVCSTANDMARWVLFILNGGLSPEGDRVVDQEDLERLWYAESAYSSSREGKPYEPVTDSVETLGLGYFNGHYRGYRTHFHGGDLNGFHSEVYMLPDMKIGTFFNTNTGSHSSERTYVHRFMVDVLLGVEPAYNATEVCKIFEQNNTDQSDRCHLPRDSNSASRDLINLYNFFSDYEISVFEDLDLLSYVLDVISEPIPTLSITETQVKRIHSAKTKLMNQNNNAARAIDNYEGEYGNFIFGNVTVTDHTSCIDCLYMEYGRLGKFVLQPTNTTDYFVGFGAYPSSPIVTVTFSGEDDGGNALNVLIPLFEFTNPPLFERGLLMSEAPEPRNELCVPFY